MRLPKFFRKDKKKKKSCVTCKFNQDLNCNVGTRLASKGVTGLCFEGEWWQKKDDS